MIQGGSDRPLALYTRYSAAELLHALACIYRRTLLWRCSPVGMRTRTLHDGWKPDWVAATDRAELTPLVGLDVGFD